jgi:hypothetical protein
MGPGFAGPSRAAMAGVVLAVAATSVAVALWLLRPAPPGPGAGAGASASPRATATPGGAGGGRIILRNLACWPTDTGVLVDLDNPDRAALDATISLRGGAVVRTESRPAGQAVFRWVLDTGLSPDTGYELDVHPRSGTGGIIRFGFRTRTPAWAANVRTVVGQLGSDPDMFAEAAGAELRHTPDLRALPAVARAFRAHRGRLTMIARLSLTSVLEVARAKELVGELFGQFADDDNDAVKARYARALASVRDARALDVARSVLASLARHPATDQQDSVERIASGLGALPGAATVRFLDGLRSHPQVVPWGGLAESMVCADRHEAATVLVRGLLARAPSPATLAAWPGIAAAALIGEPAVEALAPYLDSHRAGPLFGAAVHAMTGISGDAAGRAIQEALARAGGGGEPALLLAAGARGASAVAPLLRAGLAPGRAPALRAAAALALGLLAAGPAGPIDLLHGDGRRDARRDRGTAAGAEAAAAARALVGLLEASPPELAETAVWALRHFDHPDAMAALRRRALGAGDASGRAALALGCLADRESAPALGDLMRRLAMGGGDDPAALPRRAGLAAALALLDRRESRPELEAQARLSGKERALAASAAREALRQLASALPAAPAPASAPASAPADGPRSPSHSLWVDPISPLERTRVFLAPGESVEVRAAGVWAWGGPQAASRPATGSTRAVPGQPPMGLLARLGGRTIALGTEWTRILADAPGELLLVTMGDPYRTPPGADASLLPSRAIGLSRVELRR